MFEVKITGLKAKVTKNELLTTGTVGAQVKFTFSDDWADKTKTAVFKRCGKVIDVLESDWGEDNAVIIPPEMTEKAGQLVGVGIYGRNTDGKKVTPTIYAPLGVVAIGADPSGDESSDPTLPVYSQIQADLNNVKDDLDEVSKRAVQADWNQNDPDQPDYVKNRIAYDESEYILAGADYITWSTITNYGTFPIPKVVTNGKIFYNVEATNKDTWADNPYIAYRLDDATTITVYLRQQYIAPATEMYTYSEKVATLSSKFVPPISWIKGDDQANCIIDRPGGYIKPSEDRIGISERRTSGGNNILPYADRIIWAPISATPGRSTPVRIAGTYVDGTTFDACCIFGAVYKDALEPLYGKNPFRFTYTDAGGVYAITAGIVKYCVIYKADAIPWSVPFLPTFTAPGSPPGYGVPNTPSEIPADTPYKYVRRQGNDLVYPEPLAEYDKITDIKTLVNSDTSMYFIRQDPAGYLSGTLGIEDMGFPVTIIRRREAAASVVHNYLYVYTVYGDVWLGDIVTPGNYVQRSEPIYIPVYYCHIDEECTTDTKLVFTETNTFINTVPADRIVILPNVFGLPDSDGSPCPSILFAESFDDPSIGLGFFMARRNFTNSDDRLQYDVVSTTAQSMYMLPALGFITTTTVTGTKLSDGKISIPQTLEDLRAHLVRPLSTIIQIPDSSCWFILDDANLAESVPKIFSQIYAKDNSPYLGTLTYVSSTKTSSEWTFSERALFA